MHYATSLDAEELLSTLTPALAEGKLEEALDVVRKSWTVGQLVGLLGDRNTDVRKVAALALGFVGDATAIRPLAVALHDKDAVVHQMAEHALWCIWFRSGKPRAVSMLKCGSRDLDDGNYEPGIEKFSRAIESDPTFAEALNQRAIAFYLSERYAESIRDCKAALALVPEHFGAMSGMGHCYAHLHQYAEARRCYRLALAINPRLEGVDSSLRQVEQILKEASA